MEKRIFIAIALSFFVLFGWAAIAPKLFPEMFKKPAPATTSTSSGPNKPKGPDRRAPEPTPVVPAAITTTAAVPAAGTPAPAPAAAAIVQRTVIDTPDYTAVLSNRGAQLVSFKLKHYHQKKRPIPVDLVKPRDPGRTDYPFTIVPRDAALKRLNEVLYQVTERKEPNGNHLVEYRYSDGTVTAAKTFRFTRQPYLFDFSVSINPPTPYRVAVGPGIRALTPEETDSQVVITGNGVVQIEDKFKIIARDGAPTLAAYPGIRYIGIEDNYFLTVLRPSRGGEGVLQKVAFVDGKSKTRRDDLYASVNSSAEGTVAGDAFFGPKETNLLDAYNMSEALQFGWFGMIARFFLEALVWINQFTHNYGWSIVVLTILIKIVLYPLQHKQNVSMKKMQKVQPKVEAIKARYKKAKSDAEQRQKMNAEMMGLYQKEGINPAAGCLPLFIQLPILWGFYNLLSRAIELRGAPFILWIHDLSEKDPYYITPILMTATMFIQTWLTPMTGDPMQRKIFLIMPLVFGFLFKDFPSGLVLYWLVQNVLTIIQQLIMNKWWRDHPDNDDKDKDKDKDVIDVKSK
ncbi:MAG TPA: membrane protein insertase YidC [Thermoanaerobaculia bacterium]|nr:membrane protein insertase YidC [Thermoanaerobaculia bacterium]